MYDSTPENKDNHEREWSRVIGTIEQAASRHAVIVEETDELRQLRQRFYELTGRRVTFGNNALNCESRMVWMLLKELGCDQTSDCTSTGWDWQFTKGDLTSGVFKMTFDEYNQVVVMYGAGIALLAQEQQP